MTDKKVEEFITCTECQAGRMYRKAVTYMTYIGNELISVPNFPAWVCDVCGQREYDNQALNQLSLLLSPNAGRTPGRKPYISRQTGSKPKEPRIIKPD
jgi:YgiT-type zinc finger domain-containing protein